MTGHTKSTLLVTKKKRDHRQTRAQVEKPTRDRRATEGGRGKDTQVAEMRSRSWDTGQN